MPNKYVHTSIINGISKIRHISMRTKRSLYGLLFILPFIIGFVFFFLSPLVLFITMSFNDLSMTNDGMAFKYAEFKYYIESLFNQTEFITSVTGSLSNISLILPSIVIYSLFVAVILNQKFRGRSIFRSTYFLPVLVASGTAAIANNDNTMNAAIQAVMGKVDPNSTLNFSSYIMDLFGTSNTFFISVAEGLVSNVYQITLSSGVQILIFLAGIQTIPQSIYEASNIDGATSWENFWKITLPMLSPIILVNSVYTVIDLLGGENNSVIQNVYKLMSGYKFSLGAAQGVVYFAIIFTVLGILMFVLSKVVYYEER
jgi:ABC-type sugar transport system permease subunit